VVKYKIYRVHLVRSLEVKAQNMSHDHIFYVRRLWKTCG